MARERVEIRFGPISYVKPPRVARPRTVDELEVAIGEPITGEWRGRLRDVGLTHEVDGEDVIRWPDESSEEEAT